MTRTSSWLLAQQSVLGSIVLFLAACGTEHGEIAGASGALEAAAPSDPVDDTPVVIDEARVDRSDAALLAALDAIDDPEARMAARFDHFQRAEAELHLDAALDRRSAAETAAVMRARFLDTPEARRDSDEADRLRSARGEVFAPTPADRAAFEALRAMRASRDEAPAAVPMGLRTPDGIATPYTPPTAEELRHGLPPPYTPPTVTTEEPSHDPR